MTAPTPGARVRITIEGTVLDAQNGIRLTSDTHIAELGDDVHIEILASGFQLGDVVNDGHSNLMRIRDEGGSELWMRPDGRKVWDDATNPDRMTVVSRSATEQ